MLRPQLILIDIALTFLCAAAGAGGAWLLRRRSSLSVRNLYPVAAVAFTLIAAAIAAQSWTAMMVLVPFAAPWAARRWPGVGGGWRISARGRSCAITSFHADGSGSPRRSAPRASGCISGVRENSCVSGRGLQRSRSCR
jgi:hypothetical protein